MIETHYVMEDGSVCHPRDVSTDAKGVLRNKSGLAVAMRGDVPRSRSVDTAEKTPSVSREVKPEQARSGYKTREVKAKAEPKADE